MKFFFQILFSFFFFTAYSQEKAHRIVFQLNTEDTVVHKQLMKQFGNILSVSPSTQIEVVCHGAGISMLLTGKTVVASKIKSFKEKGVIFYACEFSMKEKNIEKSAMLPSAEYVPAGIIEIVSKQEQGWSYIKSGN